MQFFGGPFNALMACGGFEGDKGAQWGELSAHRGFHPGGIKGFYSVYQALREIGPKKSQQWLKKLHSYFSKQAGNIIAIQGFRPCFFDVPLRHHVSPSLPDGRKPQYFFFKTGIDHDRNAPERKFPRRSVDDGCHGIGRFC